MRIFTSLVIGLPVLAVSAVVGYASIQGISRQVASLTVSEGPMPAVTEPTVQAAGFAAAGVASWAVPEREHARAVQAETALPVIQTTQLLGVDISASVVPKPRPALPLRPRIIVTEEPVASAAPRVVTPQINQTVKPAASRSVKETPKSFRMPWQTGVFQ
jgi:hypothetical protein